MVHFLYSKEGVTQGYTLVMVAYGMVILPLIQELQKAHPRFTHHCYADDAGAGGTFGGIRCYLDELMVLGPPHGYLPEPTKSILVVSPQNILRGEAFFGGYKLHIVIGSRYLWGFLGSKSAEDHWLGEKV